MLMLPVSLVFTSREGSGGSTMDKQPKCSQRTLSLVQRLVCGLRRSFLRLLEGP